jgi:hypothetical protein
MTDELTQLSNAAEVFTPTISTLSFPVPRSEPQAYGSGSQIGDGEELPAYEDDSGNDDSSIISDGFRYTPGSSNYTPSHSSNGGVNDVLGTDTKQ